MLGLFTLYLFLDTYDIRATFNRRMAARVRDETRRLDLAGLLNKAIPRLFSLQFGQADPFGAFPGFSRRRRVDQQRSASRKTSRVAAQEFDRSWTNVHQDRAGPRYPGRSLPLAYVKELATLQDQVPAFSTAEAYARIESELGRSLQECYAEIDSEPVASASLGQVYRARLATGEEVAVKVQRPDLEQIISFDVAILYRIVKLTNRFFPKANENADWEGMLREFHTTVFEEMDYVKEGRNADRFRYNFRTWRAIRVPKIYWSHTSRKVADA